MMPYMAVSGLASQLKLSPGAAVKVDNSVQPPNSPNAAPQEE